MPQVPSKKFSAAIGSHNGDLETVRVHWKKGANPGGFVASDWLLVPLNVSELISGDHLLLGPPAAELASAFKALDTLRFWLNEQRTPFSLESAAVLNSVQHFPD